MPTIVGGSATGHAVIRTVNGSAIGSEPPPSSLIAAHLAPNNGRLPRFDPKDFALLLEESLGSDEHGQPNLTADEPVNHKLICVVVRAGLDSIELQNDDPFRKSDFDRDQIQKCIRVVRLAVQKTPRILLLSSRSEDLGPRSKDVPLFAWLIFKLLSLWAIDTIDRKLLEDDIWILLAEILASEQHCSESFDNCFSISTFVEELAESMLLYLEQLDVLEWVPQPPSRQPFLDISKVFKSSMAKANPQHTTGQMMPLGSMVQGIDTTCRLLQLRTMSESTRSTLTITMKRRQWTSCRYQQERLWTLIMAIADSSPDTDCLWSPLFAQFFRSLQGLVIHLPVSDRQSSTRQIAYSMWADCVGQMIHLSSDKFSDGVNNAITSILTQTIDISDRAVGLASAVYICLWSAADTPARGESFVSGFHADIQEALLKVARKSREDAIRDFNAPFSNLPTQLAPEVEQAHNQDGPRKRLRLSSDEHVSDRGIGIKRLIRDLNLLISGREKTEKDESGRVAHNKFRTLVEVDQCHVFELMGQIACRSALDEKQPKIIKKQAESNCAICDYEIGSDRPDCTSAEVAEGLVELFAVLVPLVQRSAKARVVAMLALRRLLAHSPSLRPLDISNSQIGEWCLQSLRSSSRELRISAAVTLRSFIEMQPEDDHQLTHRNRVTTLDFLNTMWAKNVPALQETTIFALSEVASVCGEEELNIILVRFTEFLGHPNPYISGLVYAELQKLARAMKVSPANMLKPFWRTIAVVVVKNFQTRPIISQLLCDFLGTGMNVDVLLMLIEEYALPYLILTGKAEVVQRIALAHGQTTSPFDLCTKSHNFAAILSYLLTQSGDGAEQLVMSLLLDVSPEFRQQDLSAWVKLEPILIACELLKSIADAGSERNSKAYHGLKLLAQLDLRRNLTSSGLKKDDVIASFLENHVLGIITQFTATFNDSQSRQPNLEKRRCLAAIGELVKLGQHQIARALPQISACLRSAMENKELCGEAFEAWALMMSNLPGAAVEPLIDQTLAIVVQNRNIFRDATQKAAHDLVAKIWQDHKASILDILNFMPSLSSVPFLSRFESEISESKKQMDHRRQMLAFSRRLLSENVALVQQALGELVEMLSHAQEWLHQSLLGDQPESAIAELTRSILDCCLRFSADTGIAGGCGKALGRIGCLNPGRVDIVKEKRSLLAISNFGRAEETVDFIMFFLEEVLVKAFLSAPNTRAQGFLAWAMQELLKICELEEVVDLRPRAATNSTKHRGWSDLDETVRNTLTPFRNSRYSLNVAMVHTQCSYPLFSSKDMGHKEWLQTIVLDLLTRAPGENIQLIFEICLRIIRFQDLSIPIFLLPYAALNLFVVGMEAQQVEKQDFLGELISILKRPLSGTEKQKENIKLCSQRVFDVLDYMSKWLQQRKKQYQAAMARSERGIADQTAQLAQSSIQNIESVLNAIPPDLISTRAIECRSYSRALFHWEQYIRQVHETDGDPDGLLARLQEIYAQIDEPDGIEGISAQMYTLNIDQQVLEYQKGGNWTAAQNWYEIQLQERPDDAALQMNLLTCLRETGQSDALLNQCEHFENTHPFSHAFSFAAEAAWTNANWKALDHILEKALNKTSDFNVGVGTVLQALRQRDQSRSATLIADLRVANAASITSTSASSLQSCHDVLTRLHVLDDLETISFASKQSVSHILTNLDRRTKALGSDMSTKRYLLGIRRAAMTLSPHFTDLDVASGWLATAKLARKSSLSSQAFNAILHATTLGEGLASIEHAKLMWKDGHHRKAIHSLKSSIDIGSFVAHNADSEELTLTTDQLHQQNVVVAKAHLMLAKWLDSADQTQSEVIKRQYRKATEFHKKWDKGWYYLGKHYNKILDSEKTKPVGKEAQSYLTGEATKLVIENYLRALGFGSKYVFQTLPKVLTLWLEVVAAAEQPQDARRGNEKFTAHLSAQRRRVVEDTNAQIKKYVERLQPVMLFTILSQVVARVGLPNKTVSDILVNIVVRVLKSFPQQAIWTVLALTKSSSSQRSSRGVAILLKVIEAQRRSGKNPQLLDDLRTVIAQGEKLSDELLRIADHPLKDTKASQISLWREFKFNHKMAPSRLVVPIETCLIPSMPNAQDAWPPKNFRAFAREPVTIADFLDDALVLASLQRPRKLSIRGSDGKLYAVLAKPKDDLRKDQRLMEFNTMINRFLKRDAEASKRQLYIRTYAVVPLNEECGLIEWVNNLKTFREILLRLYKDGGVSPNYGQIRALLDEACRLEPEKTGEAFRSEIISLFPSVFHDWFVEAFPDPSTWFAARLRYTRSCAVMSIVGHVLGLGDRHGENILFEEENGGVLHVDFNCLFDKGLTFEKPELVPFRLTHNMLDAFGAYGYDGPFRRCCEITLTLLRANEDALMTILETFLYDPTTDFIGGKKKKSHPSVPDTPQGVLEGVRSKTRGMLDGESVPLSVGGYVEEMIKRATDHNRLARMYIGWCAFF